MEQSVVKREFSYDPETGIFIRNKKEVGPKNEDGQAGWIERAGNVDYRRLSFQNKRYFVHNLAWLYMTGYLPNREVDHIDGDGLNNKWENLRLVDQQTNMKNKKMYSNNSSGHQGIHFRKEKSMKWYATVGRNHIGCFDRLEDAIAAREEALAELGYHRNHGRRSNDK